jgi:hypothetical protein
LIPIEAKQFFKSRDPVGFQPAQIANALSALLILKMRIAPVMGENRRHHSIQTGLSGLNPQA